MSYNFLKKELDLIENDIVSKRLIGLKTGLDRLNDICLRLKKFVHRNDNINETLEIIDADKILSQTLEFVDPMIKTKGITIQYDPSHSRPLKINEGMIQQILINIIKNSSEALTEGKTSNPTIKVSFELDKRNILIHVEDNGPGISEDVQKKLFNSFFTTKGKGVGTGLGLSVSKKIAQNYSGDLTCESTPDSGCTFTLSLPFFSTEANNFPVDFQADIEGYVLIVDDEEIIRESIHDAFACEGLKTIVAENGKVALEKYQQFKPQVVITDFHMPVLNGIELCEKIKALDDSVIVIGITGSRDLYRDHDQRKFDYIFDKPFNLEKLLKTIQEKINYKKAS
jgi:two-component system NtrC family sensor kinase